MTEHERWWRMFWRSVAACLVVWGILAAVWVSAARSAPVSPATAATVQGSADQWAAWLSSTLHAEVPSRSITLTDALSSSANVAEFYAEDGHVLIRTGMASAIADLEVGRVRADGAVFLPGVHVVVHELLHRQSTSACWGPDEEGIVDALTVDLMAAWGARFLRPVRTFGIPVYTADVARIRATSARATGSSSWRAPAARRWIRTLWGASCEGRTAMLEAASAGG